MQVPENDQPVEPAVLEEHPTEVTIDARALVKIRIGEILPPEVLTMVNVDERTGDDGSVGLTEPKEEVFVFAHFQMVSPSNGLHRVASSEENVRHEIHFDARRDQRVRRAHLHLVAKQTRVFLRRQIPMFQLQRSVVMEENAGKISIRDGVLGDFAGDQVERRRFDEHLQEEIEIRIVLQNEIVVEVKEEFASNLTNEEVSPVGNARIFRQNGEKNVRQTSIRR